MLENDSPRYFEHIAKIEAREKILKQHTYWLGGIFSPGGSFQFHTDPSSRYNQTPTFKPRIEISDSDRNRQVALQKIIGGNISKRSDKNSYRLNLSPTESLLLARTIHTLVPSQKPYLDILAGWETATPELQYEMVQLYREMKKENVLPQPSTQDYSKLLFIREYVAGVLDSRSEPRTIPRQNGSTFPKIVLRTPVTTLRTAFQEKFGGSFYTRVTENGGTTVELIFTDNSARNLYEFAKPFLILRAQEAAAVFEK